MVIDVIPYAASFRWYAAWIENILDGSDNQTAVAAANTSSGMRGKNFARCHIPGNNGIQMLSIAVDGGASQLKRESLIHPARLSDHGNWRKNHIGAIEAIYGKYPFFQHFIPYLRHAYDCDTASLRCFNASIHKALTRMIAMPDEITPLSPHSPAAERGKELLNTIDPDISIIDPLMRLGHESLLPLLVFATDTHHK